MSIALKAREALQAQGIGTRVVSMPCMELFAEQDEAYRRKVLPAGNIVRIGIEAGVRQGWDRWLLGNADAKRKQGSSEWTVSAHLPLQRFCLKNLASRLTRLSKWRTTCCKPNHTNDSEPRHWRGFSFSPLNVCENVNANIAFYR